MSATRVALANSTNSPRSSSRPASTRFISKPSSRKSAPTCTVSLANVNANDLCVSFGSISSSPSSPSPTHLIPFPSLPAECSDTVISQPDRTCLLLLRSSSETHLQPRRRASPVPHVAQQRRKRVTARLSDPSPSTSPEPCSGAEPLCQPPRKRPRLQNSAKPAKRVSPTHSSDLRCMAFIQRCVAGGVLKRQAAAQARRTERSAQPTFLETQDKLLAGRLRTRLLAQGLKEADFIDLDCELQPDFPMDVDEPHRCSGLSVDMDIDVERHDSLGPTLIPSSLPRRSAPPDLDCLLSVSQLVAVLHMRHHARKPSRPNSSPESRGTLAEIPRRPSPLSKSTL
ncbi:hypothetical protein D9615_002129 [Tricholomella constricta]|uniref:Uncharacterized protein n=1 Tax=Tricholomella constricta TaxID=117010 RepID=A0A8H5MAV0_9AGAR|nr:hypothetical protein D9615_002129 [Tricholomella constricta]